MTRQRPKLAVRALRVALWAFVVAMGVSWPAQAAMVGWPPISSLPVLLFIILLGVAFDIVGVAATRAHEQPFHARSATRQSGARKALRLVREADRVATFCSDMVGDLAGALSGALATGMSLRLFPSDLRTLGVVLAVSLVSAVTIGLKSAAKGLAVRRADEVVWLAGRFLEGIEAVLPLHILEPAPRRRGGV